MDQKNGMVDTKMKNLFDATTASEIRTRLETLRPDSQRQWGKMTPAQALAHCARSTEWTVKDSFPPRIFIGRILGGFVKPHIFKDDAPLRPGSPTTRELIVRGEPDFDAERQRLTKLLDRFVAAGPAGCTTHPHPFFGKLTAEEWAILMYKHLDHHLRQFGA
jgi:hypothetical protein